MMMTKTSDIKMAIVQFGYKPNEESIKKISIQLSNAGLAHWYFFDETADREFELRELKRHYDFVYEFKEII